LIEKSVKLTVTIGHLPKEYTNSSAVNLARVPNTSLPGIQDGRFYGRDNNYHRTEIRFQFSTHRGEGKRGFYNAPSLAIPPMRSPCKAKEKHKQGRKIHTLREKEK
jgi:hypothetical protein